MRYVARRSGVRKNSKFRGNEVIVASERAKEGSKVVCLCVAGRVERERERGSGEKDATRKGARDETLILSFVNFPYA